MSSVFYTMAHLSFIYFKDFIYLFIYWWDWSLNSGLHAYKPGTLLLELHLQSPTAHLSLHKSHLKCSITICGWRFYIRQAYVACRLCQDWRIEGRRYYWRFGVKLGSEIWSLLYYYKSLWQQGGNELEGTESLCRELACVAMRHILWETNTGNGLGWWQWATRERRMCGKFIQWVPENLIIIGLKRGKRSL
jgi:hypothetical protein